MSLHGNEWSLLQEILVGTLASVTSLMHHVSMAQHAEFNKVGLP
jgi:hypothetical protein